MVMISLHGVLFCYFHGNGPCCCLLGEAFALHTPCFPSTPPEDVGAVNCVFISHLSVSRTFASWSLGSTVTSPLSDGVWGRNSIKAAVEIDLVAVQLLLIGNLCLLSGSRDLRPSILFSLRSLRCDSSDSSCPSFTHTVSQCKQTLDN